MICLPIFEPRPFKKSSNCNQTFWEWKSFQSCFLWTLFLSPPKIWRKCYIDLKVKRARVTKPPNNFLQKHFFKKEIIFQPNYPSSLFQALVKNNWSKIVFPLKLVSLQPFAVSSAIEARSKLSLSKSSSTFLFSKADSTPLSFTDAAVPQYRRQKRLLLFYMYAAHSCVL